VVRSNLISFTSDASLALCLDVSKMVEDNIYGILWFIISTNAYFHLYIWFKAVDWVSGRASGL